MTHTWAWAIIGLLLTITAGGIAESIHLHNQRDRDGQDHP
jgi:CHASE1-domain containing sensor protein